VLGGGVKPVIKSASSQGGAVAREVMIATPAVRNMIREGKTHQIYSAIQAGGQHGMVSMDQSLAQLVQRKVLSYDEAVQKCRDLEEFNRLVGR
jgi:twitching motility protein PilT